ncbi:MAG: hypothetical protein M3354_00300 [Chloroflexota bacterium]|nr:hypothetical protein [Chloroflexota bacterium]
MLAPRTVATPPSPLDPFIGCFLREIEHFADGYAPFSHVMVVAEALDWPPAFAEAIFTSARVRGFVEPYRGPGHRKRSRWQLSGRGQAWLDRDANIAAAPIEFNDGNGHAQSPA